MSQLDDIIQRVHIEGIGEEAAEFQRLGESGSRALEQICASAEKLNGGLLLATGGVIGIAAAVAGLAIAFANFAYKAGEVVLTLDAIGQSAGQTANEVAGIESAFVKVGVSHEHITRAMQRTTQLIAQSWAEIQRNSREAGLHEEQAAAQIVSSQIGVAEARNRAATASQEWAQKLRNDAMSVREAYTNLQFTAVETASKLNNTLNSVASAQSALQHADIRLRELRDQDATRRGEFIDPQTVVAREREKRTLEMEDAEQQRKAAQQRLRDAAMAAAKAQAEAPLAGPRAELRLEEAQLRERKDQAQQPLELARVQNNLVTATTGLQMAMNRLIDVMQRNVQRTEKTLMGEITGVRPEDLTPQQIAQAAAARGGARAQEMGRSEPNYADVWQALQDFVHKGTIRDDQLIAMMTRFGFSRYGGGPEGVQAAQIFKGTTSFEEFAKAGEAAKIFSKEQIVAIQDLVRQRAELGESLRNFGADVSAGVGSTVQSLHKAGEEANQLTTSFDKLGKSIEQHVPKAESEGHAAAPAAAPAAPAAGKGEKTTQPERYEPAGSTGRTILEWLQERIKASMKAATTPSGDILFGGFAGGGPIEGPGSGTSDNILIRASHGEYMMKSAAVQHYGTRLFHALNTMSIPGFAMGGPIGPVPVRSSSAEHGAAESMHVVNLHIGDEQFQMRAPESVADRLKTYAVHRQTTRTGNSPSWMR